LVASSGCSKTVPTTPRPLRLYDRDGVLLAQLTDDGAYLEGSGHRIGTFDAATGNEVLDDIPFALNRLIHWGQHGEFDLWLPIGTWHVAVATTGDVQINGRPFGRIDGYEDTPAGRRRAAALIAGVPVLTPHRKHVPPAAPTTPQAAKPMPPPPPPPPLPLHHHHARR
jgi:hypothetical protein